MSTYKLLAGIDWGTEFHKVCVIDTEQTIVAERVVEHSGKAIGQFLDWLTELVEGEPGRAAVAIEMPRGALVESIVERGIAVFAINPKQLDRFRDRYTMAGAKDDRRDAFVLADSLRTDEACFRKVRLDDPAIIQLRELSRVDEELQQEMNRLSNRLREQLHRYFPQVLRLCPTPDEPWAWDLLDIAPTPAAAARLRPSRVQSILRSNHIRRLDSAEVIRELRAPALVVAPGTVEAASAHVALLLPRLRLVRGQRKEVGRRIQELLDKLGSEDTSNDQKCEHRDVEIIQSLPGVGRIVAATLLAEASQPLADRDYHALRCLSGVAPITRQSGKRRVVIMRRGCSNRLRQAMYHAARTASQVDPASREIYTKLRCRGHKHARALRTVADRLFRVLVGMLDSRTLYNPNLMRCQTLIVAATEKAA